MTPPGTDETPDANFYRRRSFLKFMLAIEGRERTVIIVWVSVLEACAFAKEINAHCPPQISQSDSSDD